MLIDNRLAELFKGKRLPIKGGIELTSGCNLSCLHCYIKNAPSLRWLSYKQICRIMDEAVEAGCLLLHFTGGEPLLRKDFFKIYRYAKKKGLLIKILTNATLINEEIASLFEDLPPYIVEVSLYGISKKIYEGITQVKGSYEACMKGIGLLINHGVRTELKTTVLTLNIQELSKMGNWAKKKNIFFKFDPVLRPAIDGKDDNFKYALPADKVVELDLIKGSLRKRLWEKEFEASCLNRHSSRKYTCDAGRLSFMVDSSGKLLMCKMYPRLPGYDLIGGSFSQGWKLLEKKAAEKHPDQKKCSNCASAAFCDKCSAVVNDGDDKRVYMNYYCKIANLRRELILKGQDCQ